MQFPPLNNIMAQRRLGDHEKIVSEQTSFLSGKMKIIHEAAKKLVGLEEGDKIVKKEQREDIDRRLDEHLHYYGLFQDELKADKKRIQEFNNARRKQIDEKAEKEREEQEKENLDPFNQEKKQILYRKRRLEVEEKQLVQLEKDRKEELKLNKGGVATHPFSEPITDLHIENKKKSIEELKEQISVREKQLNDKQKESTNAEDDKKEEEEEEEEEEFDYDSLRAENQHLKRVLLENERTISEVQALYASKKRKV